MTDKNTGPYAPGTYVGHTVDGDISKTGALDQIRPDKKVPTINTPRPIGRQPK